MKNILWILMTFIVLVCNNSFAQIDNICGTNHSSNEENNLTIQQIDLNQEGGLYLTAQGELKVLVVFVRFRDDISSHPYWPAGQSPQNYTTFVDPDLQTNSTHYINLTNYFKKMSLGLYKVTGQAIYVETPHDKLYYNSSTGISYYLANKDVLQNVVDPIVNFNDFDNWSTSSNYNHQNLADGTVDMVIMVWRGLVFSDWWSGEASLGRNDPAPPYNTSYYVENGTKLIKAGFGTNAGSGITVQYWGERAPERNFKVTVHEISHWLLGGSHPYNTWGDYDNQKLTWGMLTGGNEGICANTYERERLAWINPTSITGDILNAPFQDYVEYGTAYKYHPPNGEPNENYYFENHQKINIYDNATPNQNDKGIFAIHQKDIYRELNSIIRIKTANGQWNWQNPFNSNCWGATVPAFKPISINRAGLNNRDKLPKSSGGADWLFSLINSAGTAVCGDWQYGGGLNNSFNLTYNDVFSPYSNPYTHTWNNLQNNFTMEVIGQSGSVVNAKFYLTNPLAGKPSKPQNFAATFTGTNPVLTWEANIESDMSSYKIYYMVEGETGWGQIGSVPHVQNVSSYSWTDLSVTHGTKWDSKNYIHYKVAAVDNTAKESICSDESKVYGHATLMWKTANGEGNQIEVKEYGLQQNYPNPFNPSTEINYQIPSKGFVTLKVYDMLGNEVAVLVNEWQESGNYNAQFTTSGKQLASGMYFYTLTAGKFTDTKKFLLMK